MAVNGVGRKFDDLLTALEESLALFPVDELKAERRLIIEKIVARRDFSGSCRQVTVKVFQLLPGVLSSLKAKGYEFPANPLLFAPNFNF